MGISNICRPNCRDAICHKASFVHLHCTRGKITADQRRSRKKSSFCLCFSVSVFQCGCRALQKSNLISEKEYSLLFTCLNLPAWITNEISTDFSITWYIFYIVHNFKKGNDTTLQAHKVPTHLSQSSDTLKRAVLYHLFYSESEDHLTEKHGAHQKRFY